MRRWPRYAARPARGTSLEPRQHRPPRPSMRRSGNCVAACASLARRARRPRVPFARIRDLHACRDEGAQWLHLTADETLRKPDQPVARAREQQAVKQFAALLLVRRRRPVLMRGADALDVGEEYLLLGQSLIQCRPRLEQGLVCDLHQRPAAGIIVGTRRQQPRLGERADQPQRVGRKLRAPCGLAHPLAVVEPHPHQMRYEGVAQRRRARARSASSA